MKKLVILLTLGLLTSGATQQAHAVSITGSLDMGGRVVLNNTLLGSATATAATSALAYPTGVRTSFDSEGTFAAVPAGVTVPWKPFSWTGAFTPIVDLWRFTLSGTTYAFDLQTVTVAFQDNTFLNLSGTGLLRVSGFDDTLANWSFIIQNAGGAPVANRRFSFNNGNAVHTPEAGSSLAMLGLGLLGLGILRNKFAPKS